MGIVLPHAISSSETFMLTLISDGFETGIWFVFAFAFAFPNLGVRGICVCI